MVVTAIEQQKHHTERYSIFIDDIFAFGLIMQDILYFKLKEGEEISQEKYDFIMENIIYIKAQDTAINYISYKMRTEKEVIRKLQEKEYSEDVVERVIQFLKKYQYVDDYKYCCSYIKESIKLKPKGAFLLKKELKERGISIDTIERALEQAELKEVQSAEKWIHKKIKDFSAIDEKKKNQVFQFLLRKGYNVDCIKEAFLNVQEQEK